MQDYLSFGDFDFIYGSWNVHNRKIADNRNPDCEEWIEFQATSEVSPILRNFGHIDRMTVIDQPNIKAFEGLTLRLFDPDSKTWRIWWSSTRVPGKLDPAVEGKFLDNRGIFECDDIIGGRKVKVRFEWLVSPEKPVWQQYFSYDGGRTWRLNWTMTFSRTKLESA